MIINLIYFEELHIAYHKRLTGQFFRHSKCELKYLNLEECSNFNDKGLNFLAIKNGLHLKCLITFPISTNQRLEFICSNFSNLNVLKLTFLNENLNLDILINNLNLNHNLISLSLNRSIKLNDYYLSKLIVNFKKIKEFELCPINNQLIYYSLLDLTRLWTKLIKLRLSNIKLTTNQNRSLFESILNLNFLSYLSLENLKDIDEKDIAYLLNKLISKKLNFVNLEYYQKQPKIKFNLISIENSLYEFRNLNYKTSIYQLRLEKHNPYLYLSKIRIYN